MDSPSKHADPLRWGILGCARVAKSVFAPGVQRSANGVLYAVASRTLAKAQQFAASFNIEHAYGSYEALLDDPKVQAVYIALPNSMHMPWTVKAAEKGKHVICDKPLAANAREAATMVDTCRRHGVQLMEWFTPRFHPQNQQVKKLLDDGRIGKPMRISITHSTTMPPADDIRMKKQLCGGVLGDMGCYCVNMARYLFAAEPTSIYATAQFGQESGVDERISATLHFSDDRVAHMESSYHLDPGHYMQGYEVFASKGRIYVSTPIVHIKTYREQKIVDASIVVGDEIVPEPTKKHINIPAAHQWQITTDYFAEHVLNGTELQWPGENGLANMKVLDAILQSAQEGRPVTLDA